VPVTTLRWYERVGVIDPPEREGGKRRYDPAVLMRLMLIRFCRVAGLGLDEIREVVVDTPDRRRTKEIAAERVVAIDAQIESLQLARDLMVATLRCVCDSPEACVCGAMSPIVPRLRAALDG
jgi:MerR family redox-sensitive transcriptional activator SoxR